MYELVPEDRIEPLRIGDNVKVKIPENCSGAINVHHGVIISIDEFENPAVTVAYLDNNYQGAIKILTVHEPEDEDAKKKKRPEIVRKRKGELLFDRKRVLDWFDDEIRKLDNQKLDIERRKAYFLEHFDDAFLALRDRLCEQAEREE